MHGQQNIKKRLKFFLQKVNLVFNFIVRVVVIYSCCFETFYFPVKEATYHRSVVQVTVTEWVWGLTVLCVLQEPAASILTVEKFCRSNSIKFICVVTWMNPSSSFLCHFSSLAVGVQWFSSEATRVLSFYTHVRHNTFLLWIWKQQVRPKRTSTPNYEWRHVPENPSFAEETMKTGCGKQGDWNSRA